MRTIQNFEGKICYLSDEIFEIAEDIGHHKNYPVGTQVRLISGVDDSPVLGYHYNKNWLTVCPVGATEATFLGFPKKALRKVK